MEDALEGMGITVFNPCRIVLHDCPKEDLPERIAFQCVEMIDKADAVVLFADYYGRDCAAEVGYAVRAGKPVLPVTLRGTESENLLVDWFIRPLIHPLSRSMDEIAARLAELQHPEAQPRVLPKYAGF